MYTQFFQDIEILTNEKRMRIVTLKILFAEIRQFVHVVKHAPTQCLVQNRDIHTYIYIYFYISHFR